MADTPTWSASLDEGASKVSLGGELDFSGAPKVRVLLEDFRRQSTGDVTLELGGLEYLDSSGLALLIELRRKLEEAGRSLRLSHVQPQVEKIFRLTQVAGLFGL